RVVTAVTDDVTLTVDRPFAAAPAGPTAYIRATPRLWVAADSGLWRFEPGTGFQPEGSAAAADLPVGQPASDVALVPDPASRNHVVLLAGIRQQGLFRGVHDRTTHATAWTRCPLLRAVAGTPSVTGAMMGRIKVTITPVAPFHAYAILEDRGAEPAGPQRHPTRVYHSTDLGVTWTTGANRLYTPAGTAQGIADYTLVIAVDPANPARVIAGSVDLYVSTDSGGTWHQISDWRQYGLGDRNRHGDHHAVLFDRNTVGHPGRVWVADDAGIALTDAVTTVPPFGGWHKRSYGIGAAELTDVTVHPLFPFITGGGLRDNGTYLSYGGPTWYHVDGGDGGAIAFTSDPRRFYGSSQDGVDRLAVGAAATLPGSVFSYRTVLPDASPPGTTMRSQRIPITAPFAGAAAPFVGILEGHPTSDNHLLVGRVGRAFRSTDGSAFTAVPPALAAGEAVTAMSFLPGQGSDQFWFATSQGRVFRAGSATPVAAVPWPGGATPQVHRIAFAAAGGGAFRIAICSAGNQGELFVADLPAGPPAAVAWQRITPGLPPGPFLALAFEPDDPTRLFVGTFAGVYGATDLPAFPIAAPPAPTWKTYNAGLPVVIVHDLAVSPVTKTLRCATHGRGMFERDLAATPATFRLRPVTLLLRNHVMDDGRDYPAGNTLRTDPRLGAAVAIDDLRSFDVRVDAPLFRAFEVMPFGEPIDGAELDEKLVHDSPIAGDRNVVYVQVQNRGNGTARNAQVHLFWAPAADPAHPPDLQAGFRAAFPGDPPAGPWQRVGPAVTVGEIGPGQPAVVQFDWVPPLDLGAGIANAALLAITTQTPDDPLNLGALAPENDVILNLVRNERRVAARVTPVVANPVYLRDGVDDDGSGGAVAWGGRSPDIVVLAAAPPADVNTNAAFTDLDDPRRGDRVRGGANPVIVRVHNRSGAAVVADVDLYRVPLDALDRPAAWTRLNAANAMRTPAIPPRSWRFTAPVTWTVPAADTATAFVLVAVASPVVAGGTPKPDPKTDVSNLETLWRFVRSGALSDKVAMRALRRA
ncbi:MAG TPA: hypothetical protein VFE33_26700, partial [Thermoanaerobaculia bacterium]|nr:hypothetical protein [Thermoanaerobaculia bacterium]